MDCSLPGSSLHGIFQARVLEWGVISFSRGSSRPRDRTQVSRIAGSQREELRPWQRSWGRRLRHTQRRDQASGDPLLPSIYPQNQSLPTLLFHALTYTSDFTGGFRPITSLREGVNLQLQVNKNYWVWQGCLRSNLSAGRLACVTGLSILLPSTWLFTTSQP